MNNTKPKKWTLLLTGDNHGLVGEFGNKWEGHPEEYRRVDVCEEAEVLSLHRQLAAEKLRADQGWKRYEAKNRECLELREKIASSFIAMSALDIKKERSDYLAAFPDVHFAGAWTGRNEQDFAVWLAAKRSTQPAPQGYALVPEAANADEIVSRLYRRFKDWSKRGFGPDDVTWCEVKADVLAMISATPAPSVPAQAEILNNGVRQINAKSCRKLGGNCACDFGGCTNGFDQVGTAHSATAASKSAGTVSGGDGDLLRRKMEMVRNDDVLYNFDIEQIRSAQSRAAIAAAGQGGEDAARFTADAIADHVADNWPMRKYSLEEIETGLRSIGVAK